MHLGGAPLEHRTDSLSATYKKLDQQARSDLTQCYDDLCQHYQMQPTRNNPGNGHENSSVEAAHGHIKRRLEQALRLRGSCDFADAADYQTFIDQQVARHNRRNQKLIEEELALQLPLPHTRAVDSDEVLVRVTSSSTLSLRKVTYSVPSRLIGERLRVRCFDDQLHYYLGSERVQELPRLHVRTGEPRAHLIDFRHMIAALERKPMAFYNAQLRDHILPDDHWRQLWQRVCSARPPRQASYLIVQALKISAERDDSTGVADTLARLLKDHEAPSPLQLQRYLGVVMPAPPEQQVTQHRLDDYDVLLSHVSGGEHD